MTRTDEDIATSAIRRYNKCKEYTKVYHQTEKGKIAKKAATARYTASLTTEFKKERARRYYLKKKEKQRLEFIAAQTARNTAAASLRLEKTTE
tara:strand:- start:81 stop:359 length:279 start_codon:yes stop_codon:yes gene_type:complete